MAKIEKLTVDVVHKVLHDQIKKFVCEFYDQTDVRIESIDISWFEGGIGNKTFIEKIKIQKSKM